MLIRQCRKLKKNSPGQGLLAELAKHAKKPLPDGWDEPLRPFMEAADSGVFVPAVGEGETERETCSRAVKEAGEMLVQLTGKTGQRVEYCRKINVPIATLVGGRAFGNGVRCMLETAIMESRSSLLDFLLYSHLKTLESKDGVDNAWRRDEILSLTAEAVGCSAKAIGVDGDRRSAEFTLGYIREGIFWSNQNMKMRDIVLRLENRITAPIMVVLGGYMAALENGNREVVDVTAPWLRVFSAILPIGRLRERPDTWLFYRP